MAADASVFGGSSSSDPYAKITIGGQTKQTSHQTQTQDPRWTEGNVLDFNVSRWDDPVQLEMLDYDLIGEDDCIGKAALCTVSELVNVHDRTTHSVELGEGRGTLAFQAEWRDPPPAMQRTLSVVYATPPRDPDGTICQDYALLEVCLNSIVGLRAATGVSYRLRVEIDTGDQMQQVEPQEARGFASSGSPEEVVYFVVPVTFNFVQIILTTSKGTELCGVRFPSFLQHPQGCIGLRYARQSASRTASGFYQAVCCDGAWIATYWRTVSSLPPATSIVRDCVDKPSDFCGRIMIVCCWMNQMQTKAFLPEQYHAQRIAA